MPQVSVVIPLYNKAAQVTRTLDSVLNQTYEDWEAIVIDDGSLDHGPELVARCRDSRVRMIRQENQGPGAARNRGLAESTGAYVAFLDADDEWLPEFLAESIAALTDHPDCDVTAAAYYRGHDKVDVVSTFRDFGITEGVWTLHEGISDSDLERCLYSVHSCGILTRREVLVRFGGFYTADRCTFGEDYYLWLKVILNCRIYRILKPLWWYHLEDSEIGVRAGELPLHPFMTTPDPIRECCPPEKAQLLERWLDLHALVMAHNYMARGQIKEAEYLVGKYPAMRRWRTRYLSLRLKMRCPRLHRGLKRCMGR